MKFLLISLAALCVVACTVDAQGMRPSPGYNPSHNIPRTQGFKLRHRFRRDAPEEPQGSVVLQGVQPLSGPNRQPTLDLNYKQKIIDNDRTKLDAFGGANLHRGRVSPQVGFGVEHNFNKDMFVRGHGQLEQGRRGHVSPSFGADFGWRFRRDAPEEPQGSVVLQGVQPLSGPNRQPTLDLNYKQQIIDNDRTKLDAFGGANLHRGRVSPQVGFGVEHNFNKDMFVRGHGQLEQGRRGHLSPSFGADFGWRFRRDAPEEPQGSVVLQGVQPLSGPNRQPTLDLNYKQQIIDNDRTKLDAFGGANLHRGRVSPQVGFGVEHNFNKDMFVRGHGQLEQGRRGHLSPSFGADFGWRFRRDAPEEPQGSVVLQGVQPLSGPNRQPTLDLNYKQQIIDNDRTKLDAFGGANLHRGRVSPQVGFGVEHNFNKDMFVRGHGQLEQGRRGHLSPSFGADFGWRFRRDAPEEPQGSVVLQGVQPLSGPNRQPTLDLNYKQQIIDNDRTKLDAFGGANLHRGRVSPQVGFGVEHNFNKDMFVRGHGQLEQGRRGHLSPSFGADFGWRFRRDVETNENEEVLEEDQA